MRSNSFSFCTKHYWHGFGLPQIHFQALEAPTARPVLFSRGLHGGPLRRSPEPLLAAHGFRFYLLSVPVTHLGCVIGDRVVEEVDGEAEGRHRVLHLAQDGPRPAALGHVALGLPVADPALVVLHLLLGSEHTSQRNDLSIFPLSYS